MGIDRSTPFFVRFIFVNNCPTILAGCNSSKFLFYLRFDPVILDGRAAVAEEALACGSVFGLPNVNTDGAIGSRRLGCLCRIELPRPFPFHVTLFLWRCFW